MFTSQLKLSFSYQKMFSLFLIPCSETADDSTFIYLFTNLL